jgi:hypothetical protein
MADAFARLFQRTLRQLHSHRLGKLKAQKLQAVIARLRGQTNKLAAAG